MKKILILLALLCPIALNAQTTSVIGTKVLDGSGNMLAAGKWCLASTCFTVTNGVIASGSTVASATGTVTVTNTAGTTTYLTVPSVTVSGATFNWDIFVVTVSASGMGTPRIAGVLGATYTQTDAGNITWYNISQNGQLVWSTTNPPAPQQNAFPYLSNITGATQATCTYNSANLTACYASGISATEFSGWFRVNISGNNFNPDSVVATITLPTHGTLGDICQASLFDADSPTAVALYADAFTVPGTVTLWFAAETGGHIQGGDSGFLQYTCVRAVAP